MTASGRNDVPGHFGLGVPVPMVVVASPWSIGGWVCSETFDRTSIIRFLEARFGVKPRISPRGAGRPAETSQARSTSPERAAGTRPCPTPRLTSRSTMNATPATSLPAASEQYA